MTADWIIRGLMETPLIDVTDVEAVYAGGPDDSTSSDPRSWPAGTAPAWSSQATTTARGTA